MNDNDIREALCVYLDERYEKIRLIDEMRIGRARADIVAVTDKLTGYEIKSDIDSFSRLPKQIVEYNRHFEENYAVVGEKWQNGIFEHLPDFWGVICVSQEGVTVLREARNNPKFSWTMFLGLLWNSELRSILWVNGLPKLSGQRKAALKRSLIKNVPQDLLRRCVCYELFERDWTEKGRWTIVDGKMVLKEKS